MRVLYVVAAVVAAVLILVRVVIAVDGASSIGVDDEAQVFVDALLFAIVIAVVIVTMIWLWYRAKVVGGVVRLRERFPLAHVVAVVVLESERDSLEASAMMSAPLRLPGYFTLVAEPARVTLWSGRRPKLVAELRASTMCFRVGSISSIAQTVPALRLETQGPGIRGDIAFSPLDESRLLFTRRRRNAEINELVGKLNHVVSD